MTKPAVTTDLASPRTKAPSSLRWTLTSLSLSVLLPSLGTSIANVALPTFAAVFDASFQQVQWVVLAYLLSTTTLIVSAGRLGDLMGRRRLLLGGIVLFTVASALCGVAPSLGLLIAARAAQGLGAAVMTALSLSFVADSVPRDRTGRAMGLLGTMSATGTALGPSLGGALIASSGWRAIFFVMVPLGIVAWALAHRHLPADRDVRRPDRDRFDSAGTLLLAVTLTCYALAMTSARGGAGMVTVALLAAVFVGVTLFWLAEANAPSPLIRLNMLTDPLLRAGITTSALVTTVVMATLVIGPFYLSGALLLDAALVGLVMSTGPVVAALSGVPGGLLVDRLGSRRTTTAALAVMMFGAAMLSLMPMRFGAAGYIAGLALVTLGYALFQAANNTAVMRNIDPDQRGVVSGLLNLSRNLGLITGASLMGAVFAAATGAPDVATAAPSAIAAGMRMTFAAGAGLVGVALVIASSSQRRSLRFGPAGNTGRS